jgi:hypothetical protein
LCSLNVSVETQSISFDRDCSEWFPRKLLVKLTTYETD